MRARLLLAVGLICGSAFACGGSDSGGGDDGASSSSSGGGPVVALSSEQKAGIATYYDATGEGSCSFDKSKDLDVVALNLPEFAKSASCGTCLRVQGAKGEVVVRVVDSCPGCEQGHLDLSESAFEKIDDKVKGRVKITYQKVACNVSGNMSYRFKEGSSQWWTAIQVRNHRIPITKLEVKKDGAYVDFPRTDYNYFVNTKGAGKQDALSIRITAEDGQVVEDTIGGGIVEGKTTAGTVQFK